MKIFLAAPFTKKINYSTGTIDDEIFKNLINSIVIYLKKNGHYVSNSHIHEKWGKELLSSDECTPRDFKEIEESDVLIAIPGNPPSGGVCVEIGWASAFGKKVILLLEEKKHYSPLLYGLSQICSTEKIYFKNHLEICEKISKILVYPEKLK